MTYSQKHFHWFDAIASSDDLDQAAEGYRQKYSEGFWSQQDQARWRQSAAWCASLADRKRRGQS
jgi:hypothetical protein